jgi:hypothetical protein
VHEAVEREQAAAVIHHARITKRVGAPGRLRAR